MKIKRLLAMCLACILMVSAMALPASAANTTDATYTYEWNSTSRFDKTPPRAKENDTPVYIKTVEYTLPYGGYYVRAMYQNSYSSSISYYASRGEYLIADYAGYIVNTDNVSSSLAGKYAFLQGHYSDRTYDWGDCTIKWSPDTTNASMYPSLN